MGYPMTYPRVVLRNGLSGGYAIPEGDGPSDQVRRMIAGDLRRLEQDVQDDFHVSKFMAVSGVNEAQVRTILHTLFTDFNYVTQPWLGADCWRAE